MQQPFKVSTRLKDLIGRELITNDFVAVFELVKNSFDAHADSVTIYIDANKLIISDNGKGMSQDDIINKWLFVAYSAKRDGTEDANYRDKISERRRPFAGAKGVGRFSCDRLGKQLKLVSRSKGSKVQILQLDWTKYESDPKQEFGLVKLDIQEFDSYPELYTDPNKETGTTLEITELRSRWNRGQLLQLRRELSKLVNPFTTDQTEFDIELIAPDEQERDREEVRKALASRNDNFIPLVNGKVKNFVIDVLKQKTTGIFVEFLDGGKIIETTLVDRGEMIYKIREENTYGIIIKSEFKSAIYFLNRAAKYSFTQRMGIRSVSFGSVFLFRNGFRVFPIGHEHDDFFGLAHRKQQGVRRYLGNRDVIGHVEIRGVSGFDEATSRDQGLIHTPEVEQLKECFITKCIRRLERYVVDITWKDKIDQEREDLSRMALDGSSALIGQLVSGLAATNGVELVDYNPSLVRIVDEKSSAFEASLTALELLAERTGDKALLARVVQAGKRIKALQAAEAQAREAERRAEGRAASATRAKAVAESKYAEERERSKFLVAASSLDQDTILNLHHQIIMHASDVHIGVRRMMGKLRSGAVIAEDEWVDFLEQVSFRNSQILTAARFATKGGYRQQSARVEADLAAYMRDYIETVSSLWAPRGIAVEVAGDGKPFPRPFRPIEIGIVIDNLVSNAAKARSTKVGFRFEVGKGPKPDLSISVADDGSGWPSSLEPVDRVFDKGVTTTDGSGLGLYHVKQVVEGMGGLVEARNEPNSESVCGAHLVLRIPT